jgi:hypothetical protein
MLKGLLKTLKRKAENGKDEPDAKKMKTEIKEVGNFDLYPVFSFLRTELRSRLTLGPFAYSGF